MQFNKYLTRRAATCGLVWSRVEGREDAEGCRFKQKCSLFPWMGRVDSVDRRR